MHRPGTLTILRTLLRTRHAPPFVGRYRHFQQQRVNQIRTAAVLSRLLHALNACLIVLITILCCLGTPIVIMWLMWLILTYGYVAVSWGAVGVGVLIVGAGAASIASRIGGAIAAERNRRTWEILLLLPYERHAIVLHSVAYVFGPFLFSINLLIIEFVAYITPYPTPVRWAMLSGLLLVEWLQLAALSVTLGTITGCRRRPDYSALVALALGFSVMLIRAGGGWLVWFALKTPGSSELWEDPTPLFAPLLGPLVGVVMAESWSVALALAAGYLLALEATVRVGFAWCLDRLGER